MLSLQSQINGVMKNVTQWKKTTESFHNFNKHEKTQFWCAYVFKRLSDHFKISEFHYFYCLYYFGEYVCCKLYN